MVKGELKLEINIPPQHILAKGGGGDYIRRGVSSSEYGNSNTLNFIFFTLCLYMFICINNPGLQAPMSL